jgi:TonB-dependent SusC/RagA subfamily outer membrane receptor
VAPSTPLFIVDGVVVDSLDFINLYDVDYVEVLKDATIYGSRGANGVIIVHTKK